MKNLIIYLFTIGFSITVYAQEGVDSSAVWELTTISGNKYVGKIVFEDNEKIKIKTTELGEIEISKEKIKSRSELTPSGNGDLYPLNRQAYRYFLSPTAIPMEKGDVNYQNTWILFNSISTGITKNISVDVGVIPLFIFFNGAPSPFWISPKVNVPISENSFYMGLGGLLGGVAGEDAFGFGYFYGTATFGNHDRNLTIGLGYGAADGEVSEYPLLNISGMYRIGKKGYLIGESYFVPGAGDGGILFLGGRTDMGMISLDYGGLMPVGFSGEGTFILPWLSVNVPLNRNR